MTTGTVCFTPCFTMSKKDCWSPSVSMFLFDRALRLWSEIGLETGLRLEVRASSRVCVYALALVCVRACARACARMCMCVYSFMRARARMCVFVCMRVCVCVCVCARARVCKYTYMHTHVYVCICIWRAGDTVCIVCCVYSSLLLSHIRLKFCIENTIPDSRFRLLVCYT